MAKKPKTAKIMPLILLLLLAMVIFSSPRAGATDDGAFYHVSTTDRVAQDNPASWRVAEMVCCRCYKRMSDRSGEKPDFYMGVMEIRTCLSYPGGYCAGEAKCFP